MFDNTVKKDLGDITLNSENTNGWHWYDSDNDGSKTWEDGVVGESVKLKSSNNGTPIKVFEITVLGKSRFVLYNENNKSF